MPSQKDDPEKWARHKMHKKRRDTFSKLPWKERCEMLTALMDSMQSSFEQDKWSMVREAFHQASLSLMRQGHIAANAATGSANALDAHDESLHIVRTAPAKARGTHEAVE